MDLLINMCVGSFVETDDGGGQCLLCTKTFKNLQITRRHVKVVHTERHQYECTLCGKVIPNSYALRTHMNSNHGIKGVKDVVNQYGRRLNPEAKSPEY